MPFEIEERLREKKRRRTIVVIGIVNPVGIELRPPLIEVECRRAGEIAASVRIFASTRPSHRILRNK